jgi:hypothetical protein
MGTLVLPVNVQGPFFGLHLLLRLLWADTVQAPSAACNCHALRERQAAFCVAAWQQVAASALVRFVVSAAAKAANVAKTLECSCSCCCIAKAVSDVCCVKLLTQAHHLSW